MKRFSLSISPLLHSFFPKRKKLDSVVAFLALQWLNQPYSKMNIVQLTINQEDKDASSLSIHFDMQ
uniref:Uncharacterized protein n=1 Tax=Manihot esculenta TaxID=3983 RepID=A0A2C9ULN4_MANES